VPDTSGRPEDVVLARQQTVNPPIARNNFLYFLLKAGPAGGRLRQ
jgi:hypothetical protein